MHVSTHKHSSLSFRKCIKTNQMRLLNATIKTLTLESVLSSPWNCAHLKNKLLLTSVWTLHVVHDTKYFAGLGS